MIDLKDKVLAGKYKILQPIGKGGMCQVYKGIILGIEKEIAIKVLIDPDLRDRFIHEAGTLARLNHPNIIDIYWIGFEEDLTYMIMKYIDGENLDEIMNREGKMSLKRGLTFLKPFIGAVSYIHSMGIVHRDLKPSNIMVDRFGHIYLMDFGLAKLKSGAKLTQTGTALGTPYYISPEQIKGSPNIDFRADIYSIGVMLYEMFTGTVPFKGEVYDIIHKHLNTAPVSPRALNPMITPRLEKVILRCLSKSPEQRFNDAGQLFEQLQHSFAVKQLGKIPPTQEAMATVRISTPNRKPINTETKQMPEEDLVEESEPLQRPSKQEPGKISPPPKQTSPLEIQKRFMEYLKTGRKLYIIDTLKEAVDNIFMEARFIPFEIKKNLEIIEKIISRTLHFAGLGARLIDHTTLELKDCTDPDEGIMYQLIRLHSFSFNKENREMLTEVYVKAKKMTRELSKRQIEMLHPGFYSNLIYKILILWGAYSVLAKREVFLESLLAANTGLTSGKGAPMVAFSGYERTLEDPKSPMLHHAADFIENSEFFVKFDNNSERVFKNIVIFDYLRCAYLFTWGKSYYPYFMQSAQPGEIDRILRPIRAKPGRYNLILKGNAYQWLQNFDLDLMGKYGTQD